VLNSFKLQLLLLLQAIDLKDGCRRSHPKKVDKFVSIGRH
jgi:hypothetical protein